MLHLQTKELLYQQIPQKFKKLVVISMTSRSIIRKNTKEELE